MSFRSYIATLVCWLAVFAVGAEEPVAEESANECIIVDTSITGSSLNGLLWEGDEIQVLGLGCGAISRHDYVVFNVGDSVKPIIKEAWGLPGDVVMVSERGRMTVNGKPVMTPYGRPYQLLGIAKKRMANLPKPIDGFLLLGHPGSVDSSRVGLIYPDRILGFVPRKTINPDRVRPVPK